MSRQWHHIERGNGRPLVLLHGIGMSHEAWMAVIGILRCAPRALGQWPRLGGEAAGPPEVYQREPASNGETLATGNRIEKSVIFTAASTRPRARSGNICASKRQSRTRANRKWPPASGT